MKFYYNSLLLDSYYFFYLTMAKLTVKSLNSDFAACTCLMLK